MHNMKTYNHPYVIFLIAIHLHSIVNNQIHKLVEATESTNNHTIGIQLDCKETPGISI
jgi:hypothetical protein